MNLRNSTVGMKNLLAQEMENVQIQGVNAWKVTQDSYVKKKILFVLKILVCMVENALPSGVFAQMIKYLNMLGNNVNIEKSKIVITGFITKIHVSALKILLGLIVLNPLVSAFLIQKFA